MIRLICLLKRKEGLTHEEFLHHWRTVHGPLVARTKSGRHALRYEQHASVFGEFDGCTMQWFDSVESFIASTQEADYAEINADLANFLDTSALQFMLSEEPPVVIMDGPAGTGT